MKPEVDYDVRDTETGEVVEIALTDGTRIYVGPPQPGSALQERMDATPGSAEVTKP